MTSAQQASFELRSRDLSASIILPPAQDQRVMVMGGGKEGVEPETGTEKVQVVDSKNANPTYTELASLHFSRMHLNAVLLPDRTVLVSGGENVIEDKRSAALHAEIYEPSTNTWTIAARATVPRMYHSIALLLPDARVITAGSNPESANPGGGELQLELYHPPYLFRGPRPFIEYAPQELRYGQTIEVSTPEAYDIKQIHIIRPMATTHSCDTEQRLVDLKFEHKGFCRLKVSVPKQRNIAPPGWYMLFITNNRDVPSVAKWVHLG